MTVARRQMTLRAGGPWTRAAGRDDLWHRRVLARIPIRRIEYVVDLRLGVLLRAARDRLPSWSRPFLRPVCRARSMPFCRIIRKIRYWLAIGFPVLTSSLLANAVMRR